MNVLNNAMLNVNINLYQICTLKNLVSTYILKINKCKMLPNNIDIKVKLI